MFQMLVSEEMLISLNLNIAQKCLITRTLKSHNQNFVVVKECRSSKHFPHAAFLFLSDKSGSRCLGWKKLDFILES